MYNNESMGRVNIVFDGNYLYHRSFSVFSTYYRGQDLSGVLSQPKHRQVLIRKCITNFCHTIRLLQETEEIGRVVFVFDSSSWRYSIYEDYKYALTRVRDPWYEAFIEVLGELETFLRKKNFAVSRIDGAEGDDLMYVWSLNFELNEEDVVIVTGDSDLRQLITPHVAVFNDNSTHLKFYCAREREVEWNERLDTSILIEGTDAFEILLKKVVLGDKSDNIPQLRRGFGEKAFGRFMLSIYPYPRPPREGEMVEMARWVTARFCDFVRESEENVLGKVLFNLKLVWLSSSVYNEIGKRRGGVGLLRAMLEDVANQREADIYRGEYTLESIYGMMIK